MTAVKPKQSSATPLCKEKELAEKNSTECSSSSSEFDSEDASEDCLSYMSYMNAEMRIQRLEEFVKHTVNQQRNQSTQKNFVLSSFIFAMYEIIFCLGLTMPTTILAVVAHLAMIELEVEYKIHVGVQLGMVMCVTFIWLYAAWRVYTPCVVISRFWEAMEMLEAEWPLPPEPRMTGEEKVTQSVVVTELGPEVPNTQQKDADRKEILKENLEEKVAEKVQDGAGDGSSVVQKEIKDKNI